MTPSSLPYHGTGHITIHLSNEQFFSLGQFCFAIDQSTLTLRLHLSLVHEKILSLLILSARKAPQVQLPEHLYH